MRAIAVLSLLSLGACASAPAQVNRPCGVLEDSLRDVKGKTNAMNKRIDKHFEAGISANCWDRSGKLKIAGG